MKKQKTTKKKDNKNILWLSWVSYFTDVSSEMLMPILPIFFTETLGLSKGFLGLIEGIAEGFSSLLKVFSGFISDKIKKRKIFVVLGYGIPAFIKPLFIFASSWWHVFLLRFMDRTGKGLREPPRDALIAGSTSARNYGSAFGFQRMMDTMGAVTGVVILTILLHYMPSNYMPLFLIAFIPGLIAFILSIIKVKEDKKVETSKRKVNFKAIITLPRRFKFFLLPTFIFAIGNMSSRSRTTNCFPPYGISYLYYYLCGNFNSGRAIVR
jgi:sugar phosphate permease